MNIGFVVANASSVEYLDTEFQPAIRKRPDAALVIAEPFLAGQRAHIAELILEHRLHGEAG